MFDTIKIKIGIDVGSTTAKLVAVDQKDRLLFSRYERHNARATEVVLSFLYALRDSIQVQQIAEGNVGRIPLSVVMTGTVGMGIAERYKLPFIQEVVSETRATEKYHPEATSLIDIGGEDAKVVFFRQGGEATNLRMNGNCAGGTGAFIDQMAVILGVSVEELGHLAMNSQRTYPIASRCGVFCKTDVQNLVAKNVCRQDIAASIFHAVTVQTIVTLAHGYDITPPVIFCGGPLMLIPALRNSFIEYMHLSEEKDVILPQNGTLLPALGATIYKEEAVETITLDTLIEIMERYSLNIGAENNSGLQPIFKSEKEHKVWLERMDANKMKRAELKEGAQTAYIGIDSGSTTTKIVVIDEQARILFSYYEHNAGDPINTVVRGLETLNRECNKRKTQLIVRGSCSTGYGEDLIKNAFRLDEGIIETIAHYTSAKLFCPNVSFILDIGGQDMKAIFVDAGAISRIEINEACSSGCGSFVETFAKGLGYTAEEFAQAACQSQNPSNLGTRCTVFMNSKVKQVMREGATISDIAAGLAYSVVKNCLYKVLKLKDVNKELGKYIVVQGGTMRNDAVVRAIELLTDTQVIRCDTAELMGAFGCALHAMRQHNTTQIAGIESMMEQAHYKAKVLNCKGCDNHCLVTKYRFDNGRNYFSGNKCERVFTNGETSQRKGINLYDKKNKLLFERENNSAKENINITVGIPRCLNIFEEYPFWYTLLTECGINVKLSNLSDYGAYENTAHFVMSDNICFPAKLVHSHIKNLSEIGVDRIFMPFVVYERQGKEQNSYNCPIVSGYSEVIKNVQAHGTPIDSPIITFKNRDLLLKQCYKFLAKLGVKKGIKEAFEKAEIAQDKFYSDISQACRDTIAESRKRREMTILLAGRPYHADSLIQHRVSDMIAGMGINVITDDIVRTLNETVDGEIPEVTDFLDQWAFPNRILRAARWCATQGDDIQFVELTSFGCGPDAFLTDGIRDLFIRHNKPFTLLKLDDVNNIGSLKLRVRSLIESLKMATESQFIAPCKIKTTAVTTSIFTKERRKNKILIPFFTPFLSPLIPPVLKVAGYNAENLPASDTESCEWGLKYANNEVCYPATLVVGDIIKAFKTKGYDPLKTSVVMTQTGGQCRASNYIPLIKKALVDAGLENVAVVSATFSSNIIKNEQPGFNVNWKRLLPLAFSAIIYSDCIARFYYATKIREKRKGVAEELKNKYIRLGEEIASRNKSRLMLATLADAAQEFDSVCDDTEHPRVGVVGEIFLKFNPFAQRNVTQWLVEHGAEVVPPAMLNFFTQNFVNRKVNTETHISYKPRAEFLYDWAYKIFKRKIEQVNRMASKFRYFIPFNDVFEEADAAKSVISLNVQFGEGWLLPGEIISYARHGVNNVVSLQPFGCIANHIVSRGVEKKIQSLYPKMNLLSLDFDSGVSDVNVANRLLLFMDHAM